jgi:TPP-dependent pyruvate/acetoin dehydrogenase alpha subunit
VSDRAADGPSPEAVEAVADLGRPDPFALLERMCLIRAFEEKVSELYGRGLIHGLLHLGIGQEGVAVGTCSALRQDDYVVGSHRSHGHLIAKGGDPTRVMAELAGRTIGYCWGKGGSMHLVAMDVGFVTATGVVGGNIPLALGAALAGMTRGAGQVAAVFFGDGAGQTGAFHESLNLARLWSLPIVFVCENNGYAEFTPLSAHTVVERMATHARTYGIADATVDGNDVLAVREAVGLAVERARAGKGPSFVECLTYRLRGHYEGDPAKYRELSELGEWKAKDPIHRLVEAIRTSGIPDTKTRAAEIEAGARRRVEEAAEAALAAPWPPAEAVVEQVYATQR